MSNLATSYQSLRTSQRFQKRFSIGLRLVIALILVFFAIFPVLWIISASFSSSQSLSTQTLVPPKPSLTNYQRLFGLDPTYKFGDLVYQKWLFNSVKRTVAPPPRHPRSHVVWRIHCPRQIPAARRLHPGCMLPVPAMTISSMM